MQLRRFTADSTPAALGAVREALGEHAIILANRRVGDQIEIIATAHMDEMSNVAEVSMDKIQSKTVSKRAKSSRTRKSRRKSESQAAFPVVDTGNDLTADNITTGEELALSMQKRHTGVSTLQAVAESDRSSPANELNNTGFQNDTIDSKAEHFDIGQDREEPVGNNFAEILERRANTSIGNNSGALGAIDSQLNLPDDYELDEDESLADMLQTQTDLINSHFKSLTVNLWGSNTPNHSLHLQRLIGLGIGAELAVRLVERSDPATDIEPAMRESLALLKSTLPIAVDKSQSLPGVVIASGPPGAGKTTVLVKMAAQHIKEHGNESIVIICADTRRIGAFEELQAYGRILGVPTVHAHDTEELESLLSAFTHKHLVLIDHTLPSDTGSVLLPVRLTRAMNTGTVRHLFVLAAGMQSAMADALITQHCDVSNMQCVLTHLDTTARLGELFNPIIRHHLPIAYWSDAASVQQPLQKADASVLVATAVAMRRRIELTNDEKWLHQLIQPTEKLMSGFPSARKKVGVHTE